MLSIRLQRNGRKGHAVYRLIVQESHCQPTSGKVVAILGSYDPHAKQANFDKELAQKFLDNGAQPSPRVVKLLTDAGVKLPSWVAKYEPNTKQVRKASKLRKNRPAEAPAEKPAEAEIAAEEVIDEPTAPVEAEAPAEISEPEIDDQASSATEAETPVEPEVEPEVPTATE